MAKYKYDPIMMMNVPVKESRVKDATVTVEQSYERAKKSGMGPYIKITVTAENPFGSWFVRHLDYPSKVKTKAQAKTLVQSQLNQQRASLGKPYKSGAFWMVPYKNMQGKSTYVRCDKAKTSEQALKEAKQILNYKVTKVQVSDLWNNTIKGIDGAIKKSKAKDASRGHEIVRRTENYLSSIGKNNSTGKYDRVIQGVKQLLSQGFLEGNDLERAIEREADRLLKKYNFNAKDSRVKDAFSPYTKTASNFIDLCKKLERDKKRDPNDRVIELEKARNKCLKEMLDISNTLLKQKNDEEHVVNKEFQDLYHKLFLEYQKQNAK